MESETPCVTGVLALNESDSRDGRQITEELFLPAAPRVRAAGY